MGVHCEYYPAGNSYISNGDEFCVIWNTLDRRENFSRPIIWCHSASYQVTDMYSPGTGIYDVNDVIPMSDVFRALAEEGYTIIMPMHGDGTNTPAGGGWGNDTSRTRLDNALTWLRTSKKGGARSTGKIGLLGGSMGGATAWSYAKYKGASTIAGIATIAGTLDIDYLRGTDANHTPTETDARGIFYQSINYAYGGNGGNPDSIVNDTSWNTIKVNRDPAAIMAQTNLRDIPALVHYGDADIIIGASSDSGDRIDAAITPLTNLTLKLQPQGGHANYLMPSVYVEFFNSLTWES